MPPEFMPQSDQSITVADFDAADPGPQSPLRRTHHASRGQILILVAGAIVAMVGMVGLATDLGYNFAQRRTMQNAADAGALAGAHTLSRRASGGPSVLSDVRSAVVSNKLGGSTPSVTSCTYVDDTDKDLGNCSLVVPATATGVHVSVRESHDTFFIRAIPGAPTSLSTAATAIAHVQQLKTPPADGPFLVCGVNPKIVSGPSNTNILTKVGSNWVLNPAAVSSSPTDTSAPTFQVYGPQVSQCGLGNSSYKGLALGDQNDGLSVPNWFYYSTGDKAGQLAASVSGVQGCQAGHPLVNCVAFLPVAVNVPTPNSATSQMWTVMILPFYLTQASYSNGNLNKLNGKIIGTYITEGDGKTGWIPGYEGPIVVRLTK